MILVDTSVLIDFLRTSDAKVLALFQTSSPAICGVTRAEILHGAKGATQQHQLTQWLNTFQQVSIPDAMWNAVGNNLATLRGSGITIPFADAVIMTVAITLDVELWTRDQHFALSQQHLTALKLFQEPP